MTHQFFGGECPVLQAVDVGLGEDAALARPLVQLDAVVTLLAQIFAGIAAWR
jgi:hypothetical protein